jgi:hypothetical protein
MDARLLFRCFGFASRTGAEFPEDLAEHALPDDGVARREVQAADEAADAHFGVGDATASEETAFLQGFEEQARDALHFRGFGEGKLFDLARGFRIANQLIEADGHGLAEIHGDVFFRCGNAQEPVAMAQVRGGKAEFFGAEEERHAAGGEARANQAGGGFGAAHGVLHDAMTDGGGADDEGAIGDGIGDARELLGAAKDRGGSHRGTGFAKGWLERIDDAQRGESEIAYGTRRGADIEWIPRGDENDGEAVEMGRGGQGRLVSYAAVCRF